MDLGIQLNRIQDTRMMHAAMMKMAILIQNYNQEKMAFIIILKGGIFVAQSIIEMYNDEKFDLTVGYLGLSSYKDEIIPNKKVKVSNSLDLSKEYIEGRHVWIIDDTVQSGSTLQKAREYLEVFNPESIQTAVLVDKVKYRSEIKYPLPEVVGYTYEGDKFLVGCGLDYKERFRQLSCLYELEIKNGRG